MQHGIQTLLASLLLLAAAAHSAYADATADGLEYFEKHIRPLFAERCIECHGSSDANGGLRLDTSAGWLAGGDSGPAVISGDPEASLLLSAVRHTGNLEMPPDGKLDQEDIERLERWIAQGAPAPAAEQVRERAATVDDETTKSFWAYQPVRLPPIESTGETSANPIDDFLSQQLASAGLTPQPEASRAVLVRRLYFDLLGLPPTRREIEQFVADSTPDAYERLVDRLLASPHFGERWGRHWLDLMRFAESLTLRGFILHDAWRYRDYVIASFNDDMPYDQFLQEQIAGDLLGGDSVAERRRRLIATTWLALGDTNLEEQDKRQLEMDVVDEQLDLLGKAVLGQTIGCARCHDHKFDPISTKDYYALAGIFRNIQTLEHANVSQWITTPLPLTSEEEAPFREAEERIAKLETAVKEQRRQIEAIAKEAGVDLNESPVISPSSLAGVVIDDADAALVGRWVSSQHVARYIGEGYVHDDNEAKGDKTITFAPALPRDGRYEIRLAYTHSANRADNVPVTIFSADGEKTLLVDMQQPPQLDGRWISLGEFACEASGQNFVLIENRGTRGHVIADAVQYLPVDAQSAPEPSSSLSKVRPAQDELIRLETKLKQVRSSAPKRPLAISVRERSEVTDCPVHVRGDVHRLGAIVPRGVLPVFGVAAPPMPANESGRRELAIWMSSPANPLTARVMSNRVWYWLMGEGVVRTVDNFGFTGEAPTHPELLDYLAGWFVDHDWSVKRLVRHIVLSDAYRRSSAERDDGLLLDPENRLWWRANRRRLDAECLRDAMLLVSSELDRTYGGRSLPGDVTADYGYQDSGLRRSIYVPVLRNAPTALFEVFDFPSSSFGVGRRNRSTVAPQSLYMMNNPFVETRAAAAAKRLLHRYPELGERAVDAAFNEALGRGPSAEEREIARQVLQPNPHSYSEQQAADLYRLLFMSIDFRYCD